MKKLYPLISAAALLGLMSAAAPAMAASQPTVVYVSTTGNDSSGTGSASAPYKTINAALSGVASGGTVIVEPGTYSGSGTVEATPITPNDTALVNIDKPVTLEADPSSSGSVVIDATGDANGVYIGSSNVTVEGLTIENANDAGLLAQGKGALTNITIENNTIENNAQTKAPKAILDWEALHIIGVQHSAVLNNVVTNNKDGGIYLTDETAATQYDVVEGNTVSNNAVDCGITLAGHAPGHGVNDNTVVGNVSEGNGAAGVILATAVPGDSVSNNVVADNTISKNHDGGVSIHTHAPGSTVANNVVVDNTIGKNATMTLGANAGVSVLAGGSPITGTVVSGNKITGNYYGVFVSPWLTSGTQVSGNTFANDAYKSPGWVSFSTFATTYQADLGNSWANAQKDEGMLLNAGIKTDAQYLKLVHSKKGAFGQAKVPLQHAAENLYNQYHVYR